MKGQDEGKKWECHLGLHRIVRTNDARGDRGMSSAEVIDKEKRVWGKRKYGVRERQRIDEAARLWITSEDRTSVVGTELGGMQTPRGSRGG